MLGSETHHCLGPRPCLPGADRSYWPSVTDILKQTHSWHADNSSFAHVAQGLPDSPAGPSSHCKAATEPSSPSPASVMDVSGGYSAPPPQPPHLLLLIPLLLQSHPTLGRTETNSGTTETINKFLELRSLKFHEVKLPYKRNIAME